MIRVVTQQFDIKICSENEDLLSHEQGQRIFREVKDEIRSLPQGGLFFLDFQKIRYATGIYNVI